MTKTRPIPFSGEMVRAILDGRKTQTRRVVKPQPTRAGLIWAETGWRDPLIQPRTHPLFICPYGVPGDWLWVRETYRVGQGYDDYPPSQARASKVHYEADGALTHEAYGFRWGRVRSSRYMPRWASRITLEVTGIRVEKAQGITEADAIAEGAPGYDGENRRASYIPWVWVVNFREATNE